MGTKNGHLPIQNRKCTPLRSSIMLFVGLVLVYALLGFYKSKIFQTFTVTSAKSETTYNDWQKIAAYPWLFSNQSSNMLFSNLHNDLDELLMRMSNKTNKIALLRFNYPWQVMIQNAIYTLVKFGQVYNYIVMVGDETSLQACFKLNLPCFNGTKYYKNYYKNINPTVDALVTDIVHYRPINWFKLRFYLDVLIRNYTILALDTDIAVSRKNIWLSLERYSADVDNCDMIFMDEAPVNAGFFYSTSNLRTITLLNKWINTEYTHRHLNEQETFAVLRGYYYEICNTTDECNIIKQKNMTKLINGKNSTANIDMNMVSIRTFPSPYSIYGSAICPSNRTVDPCLNTSIYVHPICLIGQMDKIRQMKLNGFWLLEEPCGEISTNFSIENNTKNRIYIFRCKPRIFNDPLAEQDFEECDNDIAWMTNGISNKPKLHTTTAVHKKP